MFTADTDNDREAEWAQAHPGESLDDFPDIEVDDEGEVRLSTKKHPWSARLIDELLRAAAVPEEGPCFLPRSEDPRHARLLYRGKLSSIAGEPESCKSWFALLAVIDVLSSGHWVVYIDFEDDEVSLVRRLLSLGATPLLLKRLLLVHPDKAGDWFTKEETGTRRSFKRLLDLASAQAAGLGLIVLDGVTSALALEGLDPNDNAHAVKWVNHVSGWCRDYNAAGLLVDHVTKSNPKDRYASGGGQKLAGITGSQFKAKVITVFTPSQAGHIAISVTKDRPGQVRRFAVGTKHIQEIAEMFLETVNEETGQLRVWLKAPKVAVTKGGDIKLGIYWERIESYLGAFSPPRRTNAEIKAGVKGATANIVEALQQMVVDGLVVEHTKGNGKEFELIKKSVPDITATP